MPQERCAQFREKVVLFFQASQRPRKTLTVQPLIRDARRCCNDCKFFLSTELAIDETMTHIFPRDSREKTCPSNGEFRIIFRLMFGPVQREETLSRENIKILKKWMPHRETCAECKKYFKEAVRIVFMREIAYRQEICESRFPLQLSPAPPPVYVM